MKPKINKTSQYIEVIGHYDNSVLCAKLTLLADLYAIEHREGYAKFDIKDEDKLRLIDDRLEFTGEPTYSLSTTLNNCKITDLSFTLTPNSGFKLPSSISVSNATLVSYNSTSGEAVLSGVSNNSSVDVEFESLPYLIFSSPNSFTLKVSDRKRWSGTLEYSTDTQIWTTWDGTTTLSSTQSGTTKYLYMRGSNNTYITGDYGTYVGWVLSGSNISCVGNIENLLDYQTVLAGNHPTMANYCYASLFESCTSLTTTSGLVVPTTSPSGCYCMFRGCTALTSAPSLPATMLANHCYANMFQNCTSLTKAPKLSATTLAPSCYANMFYNCTSLATTPELPATTLAGGCYDGMLRGTNVIPDCSNIDFTSSTVVASGGLIGLFYGTKVTDNQLRSILPINPSTNKPYLPVTTVTTNCYSYMFHSCRLLTTAPELPATTLATGCYENMFRNCTSLTAPAIMAGGTTQAVPAKNCCFCMYHSCTSLNMYTTSSGHTPCYKAITYSTSSSSSIYYSSYLMFYNCRIDGSYSYDNYLTAGTQYYC